MKNFKITSEVLKSILNNTENIEYLMWINGESINEDEIENNFYLTQYENGQFNIEHNTEDYRIEDLIIPNDIELIEL